MYIPKSFYKVEVKNMQLAKLRLLHLVGRRAALTCNFALRLIEKITLLIDNFIFPF